MERRVALVTGASRGIGRACALALAEAGFEVVLAARSVEALAEAADDVRGRGREALPVRLDLTELASVDAAVDATLAAFGRVDVLLNNAIYVGPGSNALFLETEVAELERSLVANVVAPARLTQRLLPGMLERRHGVIINVISGGALGDPPVPANRGGWGFGYAAQKAALHKMTGVLHVEHAASGIHAYSLQPGVVLTATLEASFGEALDAAIERYSMVPPEVPAAATAWLATSPEAAQRAGEVVFATKLCRELGLAQD